MNENSIKSIPSSINVIKDIPNTVLEHPYEEEGADHHDDTNTNTNTNDDEDNNNGNEFLMQPLVPTNIATKIVHSSNNKTKPNNELNNEIRSRRKSPHNNGVLIPSSLLLNDEQQSHHDSHNYHHTRKERIRICCQHASEIRRNFLKNTMSLMNVLAKVLFWSSLVAMVAGVVWYSRELAIHGTDPHLIAWFSAGAFVILGFPLSIYAILMHLTNYYQPNIQMYVIRILWMVPIYSIESWLSLRFHEFAIYIETLRDCYESFVLYCFLQYLIEVLGGEEATVMLLKDKSPTRGAHIAPLSWCMKPWIMGQPISQPISRGNDIINDYHGLSRPKKWTSPFFVQCKLGCLQYVLLKFISSVLVMILEVYDLYKEGDFTPKGGYLYICILTNTSQCWALYCLVLFYYATKNELSPIRPIGKFLSVKALVFFTWWQSLGISILFQMNFFTQYKDGEWTAEDVAKGLQAYLICIEMFIFAIVHTFVFPHTDYLNYKALQHGTRRGLQGHGRRLGRRGRHHHTTGIDDLSLSSTNTPGSLELRNYDSPLRAPHSSNYCDDGFAYNPALTMISDIDVENANFHENDGSSSSVKHSIPESKLEKNRISEKVDRDSNDNDSTHQGDSVKRTGFVRALIESTLPRDVMNSTVGLARGDFTVERKTLLSHAVASDEYELFSNRKRIFKGKVAKTISENKDEKK